MRVACRRRRLGVAEQGSDHRKAEPARRSDACKAMPQIVKPNIVELGGRAVILQPNPRISVSQRKTSRAAGLIASTDRLVSFPRIYRPVETGSDSDTHGRSQQGASKAHDENRRISARIVAQAAS